MKNHWRRFASLLSIAFLLATWAAPAAAQQTPDVEGGEPGKLWLLRYYRVPGCEPMPKVPVVFNWLIRKALAVREFLATSGDCGQVGRPGSREGWNYVFWVERDDTAVGRLVEKARARYGLTRLVPRRAGQSWTERAKDYEPFILIQLAGEEGPARVWMSGDGKLEVTLSVPGPGRFEFDARSVTYGGKECRARRELAAGEPSGPREELPCRSGG